MNPIYHYRPSRERSAQLGGLKKVLRKVAPFAASAVAIVAGQPHLAVAAHQGTKAAVKKKAQPIEPPAPPIEPTGNLFSQLIPGDQNALAIGGTVLGGLVLAKILFGRK